MRRVVFVGMHNKSDLVPLCSSTKSGKLINRVTDELNCDTIKTNLYDVDYFPSPQEKYKLALDWHERIRPESDDIIVLLGAEVHKNFDNRYGYEVLKYPHPSSKRSHIQMDEFVGNLTGDLQELLDS